jgi:Xaa-Arg dipeptidase
MDPYADLRPNAALCAKFAETMQADFGREYYCDLGSKDVGGYSTDMGNVSYECPSFHGNFVIPVRPGENIHGPGFVRASRAEEAHRAAVQEAKGMAVTGWNVLADETFTAKVRDDFEGDKLRR